MLRRRFERGGGTISGNLAATTYTSTGATGSGYGLNGALGGTHGLTFVGAQTLLRSSGVGTTVFLGNGSVWYAEFKAAGVDLSGQDAGRVTLATTDSTGSPGNATINKASGKSAIASAATACTVTNSLVTASSIVMVTPIDIDGTKVFKCVPAAGSFTVTLSSAATATFKFAWVVFN